MDVGLVKLAQQYRALALDPGVVSLPQWRPAPGTLFADREIAFYCGVGRKP